MSRKSTAIYDEVIRLSRQHLGPESAVDISKLLAVHLRKSPQKITKDELVSLVDWIKHAVLFMAEDKETADRYVSDLLSLAGRSD